PQGAAGGGGGGGGPGRSIRRGGRRCRRERARGVEERHVGAHAASVDRGVEQEQVPLRQRQRAQSWVIVASARGFDVGRAALVQQFEIALAVLRPLVLVHAGQAQHRLARRGVLLVGQAERQAAQAEFGRKRARQRLALRAVLALDRDQREPVARN